MSGLSASARLYARIAFVRHRLLLQHTANRAAIGALAVLLILVGFGLLNGALFLYLRASLSDIGAVLVVALIHLLAGAVALLLTWQEHSSPELEALAETEAAALRELDAEATTAVESFEAIGHRLTHIGSNTAAIMAAISGLQSLVARASNHATEQIEPKADRNVEANNREKME
jgi:hypothetical protein